jgi:hypothetical protein
MFCSICQDEIIQEEPVKTECCKQSFHNACLLKWLIRNAVCPLCRLYMDPKEFAEDPDDLPVYVEDAFCWYKNDQLHRENGPAYIDDKGNKEWYYEGRLHREDGPAGEYVDGCKQWWRHGILHREDGPAIECANGDEEWLVNGKRHREGGPAVTIVGKVREWWYRGERHREDGPAVIYDNGEYENWLYGSSRKGISMLAILMNKMKFL